MELALILSAANRPAVDLVKTRTAPLDAAYTGDAWGRPTIPAIDDMLTIEPPPARRIAGTTYLVPRNTPLALTSIIRSQSSEDTSRFTVPYCDARVVDQDVQAAVLAFGEVHGALPVVFAGHVQVDIFDLAAELRDFGLDLPALVIEHVAEDDRCPFVGEQLDLDSALAFGASGYDRNLAFQPSHVHLLRDFVTERIIDERRGFGGVGAARRGD